MSSDSNLLISRQEPARPAADLNPGTSAAFHSISAVQLDGVHTDIVLHRFADKICLLISQFERIGNVFVAHANKLHNGSVKTFKTIEHRFGTDTDEIQSSIRHLVTAVPALNDAAVDIVVTLSLRRFDRQTVRQLAVALNDLM